MNSTLQALGIDRMSVDDRIRLVEEIWDSIVAEAEKTPLTDAQKQDLQRRMAAYEADRKAGSSWEEYSGPRKLDHPLSYSGGPGKG